MERRSFLKYAGAGVVGSAAALSARAQEAEISWRLVSSFPKALDTIFSSIETMAKKVSLATGGKFQIQVFPAGEIIPAFGVLDAVKNGVVEMAHTASYYFFGKNPVYALDAAVPFGLNNRQMDAWYRFGNGLALMRDFFAKSDIYNIPCGNTGAQMGGWFKQEIKSVEDLKGLKLRVGGFAGKVLSKLGALPQQIPGGETYRSLEQGLIDGAEWIGPYDDQKLGFHNVAKFYYYPGWWEGGTNLSLYINKALWENLPKHYQVILTQACAEVHVDMLAAYDAKNPVAFKQLTVAGAVPKAFPKDVLDACFKAANELYDETCSKNPTFKLIYEDMKQFRKDQIMWAKIAEGSFSQYMQSVIS